MADYRGYLEDKNENKLYPDIKDNFSTSEQVIGTFQDGKKLYRKCFYQNMGNGLSTTINTGLTNIDNIYIDVGNSFFKHNTASIPLGHYAAATDWSRFYVNLTGTVIYGFWGSVYENLPKQLYVTLCYTKTI